MSGALPFTYRLIRSGRRSMAIQIKPEGVIVRVPNNTTDEAARRFVEAHKSWIEKHLARQAQARAAMDAAEPFTAEELQELADRARAYIPQRTAYWANRMGVTYGRITVRRQHTLWGSCSRKGDLSFNCLLMLAPEETVDSVIVHELAHRREMNHSKRFYEVVYAVFPEYDRCYRWLKENGPAIMNRNR